MEEILFIYLLKHQPIVVREDLSLCPYLPTNNLILIISKRAFKNQTQTSTN